MYCNIIYSSITLVVARIRLLVVDVVHSLLVVPGFVSLSKTTTLGKMSESRAVVALVPVSWARSGSMERATIPTRLSLIVRLGSYCICGSGRVACGFTLHYVNVSIVGLRHRLHLLFRVFCCSADVER